jgi:hypothetical protein
MTEYRYLQMNYFYKKKHEKIMRDAYSKFVQENHKYLVDYHGYGGDAKRAVLEKDHPLYNFHKKMHPENYRKEKVK